MTYGKILLSSLINKAELARLMWPGVKSAETKLAHKLGKTNNQRLTDKDKDLIVDVVKKELDLNF